MADKQVVLLPAGTVLQAGEPPPPVKSNKAVQAGYWAGVPIFISVVITAFDQLGTFYPDAPDWVLRTAAYILAVAGPILGYFGVVRGTDKLEQPVETVEGATLDGRRIMVTLAPDTAPTPVVEGPDTP